MSQTVIRFDPVTGAMVAVVVPNNDTPVAPNAATDFGAAMVNVGTTLPSAAGVLWNNGGVMSVS